MRLGCGEAGMPSTLSGHSRFSHKVHVHVCAQVPAQRLRACVVHKRLHVYRKWMLHSRSVFLLLRCVPWRSTLKQPSRSSDRRQPCSWERVHAALTQHSRADTAHGQLRMHGVHPANASSVWLREAVWNGPLSMHVYVGATLNEACLDHSWETSTPPFQNMHVDCVTPFGLCRLTVHLAGTKNTDSVPFLMSLLRKVADTPRVPVCQHGWGGNSFVVLNLTALL